MSVADGELPPESFPSQLEKRRIHQKKERVSSSAYCASASDARNSTLAFPTMAWSPWTEVQKTDMSAGLRAPNVA